MERWILKKSQNSTQLINLDGYLTKRYKTQDFGYGRLAQLVEHLVYTEGVKGSSPLLPTIMFGGVAQFG